MSKNPGFGTSYSYDGHGNILSLSRGKGDGSSDLLTMSYTGNRLHGMTDGNGGSLIPESLAVTLPADTEHYAYDANGNMTRDHVSGITAMSYNRINLPETITVVDSGKVSNVSYSYTSDGTKQRASVTDASGESLTKDWCSNLVYLNGELDRILIPGGYIKDGSYRFFLTDHLGSVRAVADSEGNVLETIDYYPYGQEFQTGTASDGNAAAALDETLQPYRFNGKESQSFAGLPYLDYGARFYHPQSTRWTTMDPLAEKYYFLSPYAYCSGNPVNFVDEDGRLPLVANLVGGIVSAAVDYAGQVIGNFINEKSGVEAFTNVDVVDLGVSFAEGFVTAGGNIVKNVAAKATVAVVSEVVRNTVDVETDESGGLTTEVKSAPEVVTKTVIGVVAGSVNTNFKVQPLKYETPNSVVKSVRAEAHANGKGLPASEAKAIARDTRASNAAKKQINGVLKDNVNSATFDLFGSATNDFLFKDKRN